MSRRCWGEADRDARGRRSRARRQFPATKAAPIDALILGAMADGRDAHHAACSKAKMCWRRLGRLPAFGIEVERTGNGEWIVRGGAWRSPERTVDCGNSGTAARLLMGAVAGHARRSRDLHRRCLAVGAADAAGHTPAGADGRARSKAATACRSRSRACRLGGIDHRNVPASAQVKSAILLAGSWDKRSGQGHRTDPEPRS